MLIVQDVLISDDLVERKFVCQLNACKGACCWEGDYGAPLETSELHTLERIYPEIKPFLTKAGIDRIESHGLYTYYKEPKEYGTTLLENGACVFLTFDANGIALCGIEQAHAAGKTEYIKPLSCHLYPVRVKTNEKEGFEALNYDEWEICSAACQLGEELQVPVYQFVRTALIRKYGAEFYEELDQMAQYLFAQGTDQE